MDRELDELERRWPEVSYQALREMPRLESAIKEALRLHPPLILLLRVAKEDLEVDGFTITAGQMVGASPSVSNRIAEDFPDADAFLPERATSHPVRRTGRTPGHGSRSAPAGTAASAPPSP